MLPAHSLRLPFGCAVLSVRTLSAKSILPEHHEYEHFAACRQGRSLLVGSTVQPDAPVETAGQAVGLHRRSLHLSARLLRP